MSADPATNNSSESEGGVQNGKSEVKGGGKGRKLIPFPGKQEQNLGKYPIAEDALAFYRKHDMLKRGAFPISCFLPLRWLRPIAFALGRQITIEDLNLLIGLEACSATCSLTEQQFRPVWWVELTPSLTNAVRRHREIRPEFLEKVGCFFLHPDLGSDEILVISGHPYVWVRGEERLMENSPLVIAYKRNGFRWGHTRQQIDQKLAERKSARQSKAIAQGRLTRMGEKLDEFFKKK